MPRKDVPMEHIPFWLRKIFKLFLQYMAVAIAAIPAGMIYILCFKLSGNQNVSLVISVSVGVISAHLAWKSLDKKLVIFRSSQRSYVVVPALAGNNYAFDGGLRVATAGIALYLIASPMTPPRTVAFSLSEQVRTPAASSSLS